jgi:hypothetical protein
VLCSSTGELSSCDSRGFAILEKHHFDIVEDSIYHTGDKPEQPEEGAEINPGPGWLTPTWM